MSFVSFKEAIIDSENKYPTFNVVKERLRVIGLTFFLTTCLCLRSKLTHRVSGCAKILTLPLVKCTSTIIVAQARL